MSWKIALSMYNVAPAVNEYYRQLILGVIAGLQLRGWHEPIEIVADPGSVSEFWRRRDVLLTQTCGYPLVTYLGEHVELIATPCFDVRGCEGPYYSSALVVPKNNNLSQIQEFRGKRAVINDYDSNSGMNVLRHLVAPLARGGKFFGTTLYSGSHISSLKYIAGGFADLAAIDAVTLAYATDHLPDLVSNVRVIGYTENSPALPFISSNSVSAEVIRLLRDVLDGMCESKSDVMTKVRIKKFEKLTMNDYEPIGVFRDEAIRFGYPVIS